MGYPYEAAELSTRTRIRAAALELIAERGVPGTTLRAIARRSNVSPGLVSHHFGSKQAVIDEVSAWVLKVLRQEVRDPNGDDPAGTARQRLAAFGRMLRETPHLTGFLRHMLLDGTPDGVAWFREAVAAEAEDLRALEDVGLARPSRDVEAEAAILLALTLAPLLLQPLLESALDVDFGTTEGRARWGDIQRELLTSAVYPPGPRTSKTNSSPRT
jgi:AcrR family transcriptional regulator